MTGKLRHAIFVASLAVFLVGGDWGRVAAQGDVAQVTRSIVSQWHRHGLEACNSTEKGERAACRLDHRRALGRAIWLEQELLAEWRAEDNGDRGTLLMAALGENLEELARQTPENFGSPLGEGGRLHLIVTTSRVEDEYIVQAGSEIGWAFGSDPTAYQSVSGSFSLTLAPDGNGGFTGTVDAFQLTLEPTDDETDVRIRLAAGGQPGSVTLDPGGKGTMKFHGTIDNGFLPADFPWWFELPIEAAAPLVAIDIRSAKDVPGEEIFPVRPSTDDDCNGNGVLDETDIQNETSTDCDGDGQPDECQWDSDFNGNGFPDGCDILGGASGDLNENGIADDGEAELLRAFAFGGRELECPANDPRVEYTMVHHGGTDRRTVFDLAYDPGRGWGYEVTHPGDPSRSRFGQFGPFAEVPARRDKFDRDCPEALYDSLIGASEFAQECSGEAVGEPGEPLDDLPCAQGGLEPEGLVFRVDLPGGRYRFAGAFGDAANTHAHRIVVEDGGEGPAGAIGENSVTLVSNFDQAQQDIGETDPLLPGAGVYAAVGFPGRFPPRGDGIAPDPRFVSMDAEGLPADGLEDSPTLEVTQGYIRVHQLQGNSNAGPGGPRNPNGGDAVIIEIWRRTAYEATITVALDGTGDYTEIQPALDAAAAYGNTILVMPGQYEIAEPITFSGKSVTVRAVGPEETVIRMRTPGRDVVVFEGGDTSVLEGFTLTGGSLGVYCEDSSPTLTRCTISGNVAGGVSCGDDSFPTLNSCIVWDNSGEALAGDNPEVAFSCIEGDELWPGEGNINSDPLFCGWESADIGVDDQSTLEDALSFRLALSRTSPCIGTGEGGANMGAVTGICPQRGEPQRRIRLGPGTYELSGLSLYHQVSLEGTGQEETVIEGTVFRLRTGAVLANLTITAGTAGGLQIAPGEAPEIRSCTISGNTGSGATGPDSAGGVYCSRDSSPMLTGCTISDNSAEQGGGVYCESGSSPTLIDCTISDNSADRGGGVYCDGNSAPNLTDCTISGNPANRGGGVYCDGNSTPNLTDCTISGNSANRGGGVYCTADSAPTLTGCTISDNSTDGAANGGGGVYCTESSTPTLAGCTISGNSGGDRGGGVHCRGSSTPTLTGCAVVENSAEEGGGIYCREDSSPTLTGCTITQNSDGVFATGDSFPILGGCTIAENSSTGVASRKNSSPFLINCIIWANDGDSIDFREGVSPEVHYSCIEGSELWPGEGNINADPLFCAWGALREVHVDGAAPGPGDGTRRNPFSSFARAFDGYSLALAPDSPCRGAGDRGGDMGADAAPCETQGPTRLVHLAAGSYSMGGRDLSQNVSLEGSGERQTVIEGTVRGLRTGARLSRLAVTGGIVVGAGESPEILSTTISGTGVSSKGDHGVHCGPGSSPTLTDCTISGHSGRGVDCASDSSPTLTGCTISGNSDRGVYCGSGSSPTLTDCTISNNQAPRGLGGGVHCERDASPTFTGCTITGNSASGGAGAYFAASSSGTLINCIVWANESDSIRADGESRSDVRYSCIEGPELPEGEGNINADPLFCKTTAEDRFPLFLESPCIGTGQDGANMGAAWGICGVSERFLRGDCNGDGRVQGAVDDAVVLLGYNFLAGPEPPCLAACDADGDGEVTGRVSDAIHVLNFNFLGGPPPVAPFPECGQGERSGDETLGCKESPEGCR